MAKKGNVEEELKVIESSGNIFADFGLPDAEELQTKIKIAFALNSILEKFGKLTQEQIAERLKIDQPKVSALKRYQLSGMSVERLLDFLTILDYDIDINIKPKSRSSRGRRQHRKSGRIQVHLKAA
jgi:predicted XRE-type DNA-binding protein